MVEIPADHRLPVTAPPRRILRQGEKRKTGGIKIEPGVDAATTVEATLGIGLVEIVNNARGLHTLEFVQRMLKHAVRREAGIEHEVLADHPV